MDDPQSPVPEVVKEYPDRDQPQYPHTKVKKPPVKRRGRPPGARIAPPKPKTIKAPSEFAGMTRTDCADECRMDRCVVSNRPYCAHPRKGGLQGIDLGNVSAVNRLTAAKLYLKRVLGE